MFSAVSLRDPSLIFVRGACAMPCAQTLEVEADMQSALVHAEERRRADKSSVFWKTATQIGTMRREVCASFANNA